MKGSLITSGFVGALALGLSAAAALAQPGNFGDPQQPLRATTSPLVLVRGGGQGHGLGGVGHSFGHGLGGVGHSFGHGHAFRGGHFRGGFDVFGDPYYDDYGGPECWWSARYHRLVCR
jgi:hypothetical protein